MPRTLITATLGVALISTFVSTGWTDPPKLSNSDATKSLETNCLSNPLTARVGDWDVLEQKDGPGTVFFDPERRFMRQNRYGDMVAPWVRAGAVEIEELPLPPNAIRENSRILRKIRITPTQKARATGAVQDQLEFKKTSCKVEIVSNERVEKGIPGIDEFRVVMYIRRESWPDIPTKFLQSTTYWSPELKHRGLFRYNFFSREWKEITGDYAKMNEDFNTNNVAGILKCAPACIRDR